MGAAPENQDLCGRSVQAVTEAGLIKLICTLPPHDRDTKHYDEAFLTSWKEG